jgi:glycosyltransferase involved in cell wall biosynthesis
MVKSIFFKKFVDEKDEQMYLDIINKVQPDIIHIHGTENSFGCIINKTNIPVVVSIQGIVTVIAQKFNTGIEPKYLGIRKYNLRLGLKNLLLQHTFKSEIPLFKKMKKRELKNFQFTKYIIGRTAWDRRVTTVLAPSAKYYHCEEILREKYYEERWIKPVKCNKFIIHSTSKSSALKGFETICAALHELNKAGVINIEWRVAGIDQSDLIVKVVKKQLKAKYPSVGLVLLGNLNENQLIEKIKEANVFVMASHIENSPNNLCEAMMLGIPCIATFVGGTGTILKDGTEGVLIQDNDPWAMAGAIIELKNNVNKAAEYGQRARVAALKRHDKGINIARLLDIYEKVINNNKGIEL